MLLEGFCHSLSSGDNGAGDGAAGTARSAAPQEWSRSGIIAAAAERGDIKAGPIKAGAPAGQQRGPGTGTGEGTGTGAGTGTGTPAGQERGAGQKGPRQERGQRQERGPGQEEAQGPGQERGQAQEH